MRAENCTRYTFDLGGETHKYGELRKYVCNACGGRAMHTFLDGVDKVACGRCGGEDIISEYRYDKQVSDAQELKGSALYQHHMRQARKDDGMPLRDVEPQARLKRIETIRLGFMEPSQGGGSEHPVAADHFVLTDAPTLAAIYPEAPKSLPIYFPHRTFDENVEASYGVWVGGRKDREGKHKGGFRVCQGDGALVLSALPFKATAGRDGRVRVNRAPGPRRVSWGKAAIDFQWDDFQFHEGDEVPCPGRSRDLYTHCEACATNILIKVRIRDPRVARFGYWQISTGSVNNYLHLMSVWDELTLRPDGTRLPIPMSEVPFVLSIEPGASLFQNQKDQSWGTREAFFLKLELDPIIAQLEQGHRERRIKALLGGEPLNEPLVLLPRETEEWERPFDGFPIEDGVYEEELADDDPFLRQGDLSGARPSGDAREELREEQAVELQRLTALDLDYVPAWIDTAKKRQWGKLWFEARELLGYEDDAACQRALEAQVPDQDERAKLSYRSVWHLLQQHQKSRVEAPA
jgi:DNA-directed RNA polymerase subunit RPC12/RpoP